MSKFCTHCGAVLNGDEKFCTNCGNAVAPSPEPQIAAAAQQAAAVTQQAAPPQPAPQPVQQPVQQPQQPAAPQDPQPAPQPRQAAAAAQPPQYPPQGQQYAPQGQQYAPQGQQYAPQGQQYAPQRQQYAPQGQQYAPQGQQYAPQGQQYAPQGQQYAPQGQQYAPQRQQYPPQRQQYPPQRQQYPPQGQQYPPQRQQYPPQGQQYPPQGQPYAPQNRGYAPQAPAPVYPAAGQPQKKKKKGKGAIAAVIAVLLVAVLFLGFIKPAFFLKGRKQTSPINRVEVFIPNPTGPEAITGMVGNLALQYYIEARLYLEKLSEYDLEQLDGEAFVKLVADTVTAFENADKASDFLLRVVDLWMECEDVRDKPTCRVTQKADGFVKNDSPLFINALAAEESEAEIRAEDIVAAFDKAKNGQKIKAVATLLNTDAKHAMVQLQMAQAELEKRGYDKIADQADTCVKVAKTLKTAGAVAGLVVAAAPLATGAVATMATGEMLVTGTGVVVSAVNTGLDVVSTGAMYVYGTDQNQVSEAADAIADSKFMQTVNLVTGVAGVGYNIKNLIEKAPTGNLTEYLTSLSSNGGKEGSDIFGLLSFGLGNLDSLPGPHGQAAGDAVKTLVAITTHTQEDGLLIRIADTLMGGDDKQAQSVKELLDMFDIPPESRNVLESAVSLYGTGKQPEQPLETDPAQPIPEALVEQLLTERADIAPDGGTFDLDGLITEVEAFMQELAECEPPTEPPTEKTEPGSSDASSGSDTSYDSIVGYYRCTGVQKDNMGDDKWETEETSMSVNIKVNDSGRLVWAMGYGEYYDEEILLFDETTGEYYYSDNWDDVADEPSWFTEYGYFTFYQENGVKKVKVRIQQVDNDYGTIESVWEMTGTAE